MTAELSKVRTAFARWSPSALVLTSGAAIAVGVLATLVTIGVHELRSTLAGEQRQGELLARMVDDHATRAFETGAVVLSTLAEPAGRVAADEAAAHLGPVLSQTLAGLPFVRALALLDERRHVIASTEARDLGTEVDPQALPLPHLAESGIGDWVAGRSLADLDARRPAGAPRPASIGFVPLVRELRAEDGRRRWLVALINPGSFATYQEQSAAAEGREAVLANYRGRVLAASQGAGVAAGASLAAHPVFARYLPRREHGGEIGEGLGGEPRIVAWRASRSMPLVTLVEMPRTEAVDHWLSAFRGFAALGLGAFVLVVGMTVTAWRSLRAREQAREALDAAQARVAASERELSVLVSSVQEIIFRTDANGIVTFVNARWAALTGVATAEVVGRPLRELFGAQCSKTIDWLLGEDVRGARQAQVELPRADGETLRCHLAIVPLRAKWRIVGFAGSAIDVSERDEAERRLQRQLAFNELLLELSPQPVSMLDPQGRYVFVNRAWEAFTQRQRDEVLGRAHRELNACSEMPRHDAYFAELLCNGGSVSYESTCLRADGERREVLVHKVAVPGAGGMTRGVLTVLVDVSEFREAERATREAHDAAEEASRVKSEFIANISHELRTPLQSIIGFSELGVVRATQQARLQSMFGDIHAAGRRMLALVDDLLDVSKIDSAVGTFHLERVDLRPLVRAVARELEPLCARAAVRLAVLLPETPLVVKADPLRFEQVVRNIIANAIKFSPRGEQVEVAATLRDGEEVVVTVRDHGPGIPAAELESIFEPFVQSSRTKDGSGGTGLGLAICRKIVQAHGGEIVAENGPGGGAVFKIVLRARAAEAPPTTVLESLEAAG